MLSRFSKSISHKTNNVNITSRKYTCHHAGDLVGQKQSKVKNIDLSGKHKLITQTTCGRNDCETTNCADPNQKTVSCPGRTASQNQTSIPPTSEGFSTRLIANFTSKIPGKKPGVRLNSKRNYTGKTKIQEAVTEPKASQPKIDSKDFKIHKDSTKYIQELIHHIIIKNATQK